jgi:hypothetical protein
VTSNTIKTGARRLHKVRKANKARKRIARRGSTPAFPIHKEVKEEKK